MVKLRFLSFTLTISLRRSLTESLEMLSSEMRRLSFLSLEYSCINFERCCRGWIRLTNQHMARSNPVRPASTNHSIRLMSWEASLSEGRVAYDLHVEASAAAPSTKSGYAASWPDRGISGPYKYVLCQLLQDSWPTMSGNRRPGWILKLIVPQFLISSLL